MNKIKLSLCLATHNEESNIRYPLDSCYNLVDEIIIVDGKSNDKTVEIAKSYGHKVKVFIEDNPKMFHINKQKALDRASGEWILQLDADEAVSPELAKEIKEVIGMKQEELEKYQLNLKNRKLFLRHQTLIGKSQILNSKFQINSKSKILNSKHLDIENSNLFGSSNLEFIAFYIPRLNYFLGRFLRYGGVYPDGAIRLVKKGKAHFPCKDVHEVMEVDGKIGWLQNDLLHYDSPTFKRYIERNNRYVQLIANKLSFNMKHVTCNIKNQNLKMLYVKCYMFCEAIDWLLVKPVSWFLMTTIRHKGILDGWQGIVFSFFSALRFPRAYMKYLSKK